MLCANCCRWPGCRRVPQRARGERGPDDTRHIPQAGPDIPAALAGVHRVVDQLRPGEQCDAATGALHDPDGRRDWHHGPRSDHRPQRRLLPLQGGDPQVGYLCRGAADRGARRQADRHAGQRVRIRPHRQRARFRQRARATRVRRTRGAPDGAERHGQDQPHKCVLICGVCWRASVCSALDGRELTPQWFQECVFPGRQVSAVHVLPGSIHRGKHSAVAKLEVYFKDDGSKTIVFLKKSERNSLPARSAAHWDRDIASYRTEAAFYAHLASSVHARGVELIRPLAVFQSNAAGQCTANMVAATAEDAEHATSVSDPENFMMLLECLGPASPVSSAVDESCSLIDYEAADCLELADTHQALSYLANLHASAWGQEDLLENAGSELWPAACWWAFPKRGEKELAQALEIWPQMLSRWLKVFEADPVHQQLSVRGRQLGVEHAGARRLQERQPVLPGAVAQGSGVRLAVERRGHRRHGRSQPAQHVGEHLSARQRRARARTAAVLLRLPRRETAGARRHV
ncbi:hypothetical protein ON010_g18148 [Phytophthora cinnamomi]|nr:hypothetical protein ON010_g18148 [Phytophthora cinnamomi]